jgi:arylsulfatase
MHKLLGMLLASAACALVGEPALAQASVLSEAVAVRESLQPAVPRPEQAREAGAKLAELARRSGRRPNIIWLVADDMGYGDPGCYGGGAAVGAATPNIDRLAAGGLKLTSAYSQPTCTPTRSAMLTGRLPARTGLTRPIVAGDKLLVNPWEAETSLARLLSAAGYRTIQAGKWHIGETPGMRPFEVGFDEFHGFYPAQKELSQALDARRFPDLVLDPFKLAAYHRLGGSEALVEGVKGGEERIVKPMKSLDDVAEGDRMVADFTISRIRALAGSGQPWFINHGFMKPHADNFASKQTRGKSASKFPYKDAIVEVDTLIGEIVQALEETGQLENTLIFVTSDNGPQMDSWPDSGYTPFRGAKGSSWEGGVRVPAIAYWKGMIMPGRQSDDLFDLTDMFLTTLAVAGAADKVPTDRYIDSIDQSAFLLADKGRSHRDKIFYWDGADFRAIRMLEYKAHYSIVETKADNLDIDQSIVSKPGTPWLFNLYIDPKESYAVGHRLNAFLGSLNQEVKAHLETFKRFPPKKTGL